MPRVPFWNKVLMTDTCWLWTGGTAGSSYKHGRLTAPQAEATGERAAHRHAYALFNGPIPPGLQINHHCDVALCVRPDHLYAGTQKDNMQDALRRNRGIGRPIKDVCPAGHMKVGANLRVYGTQRFCAECMNKRARERQRAKLGTKPENYRVGGR
jgi:hypothetical protein